MNNKVVKLTFRILAGILGLAIAYVVFFKMVTGVDSEGLFHVGDCYRNDEFGITYKVTGTAKGETFARVQVSDKYPSADDKKVGAETHWASNDNSQKLYPVACN